MPHSLKIVGRAKGQFGVQFGYNAEVIVWSENYTTKAAAENCIASLKKNVAAAPTADTTKGEAGTGYRFEIAASKDKQTFIRFVAANGETMARSETYKSKSSARHAIASIKKNVPGAAVIDTSAG